MIGGHSFKRSLNLARATPSDTLSVTCPALNSYVDSQTSVVITGYLRLPNCTGTGFEPSTSTAHAASSAGRFFFSYYTNIVSCLGNPAQQQRQPSYATDQAIEIQV